VDRSEQPARRQRTLHAKTGLVMIDEAAVPENAPWDIQPPLPEGANGQWNSEFLAVHRLYEFERATPIGSHLWEVEVGKGFETLLQHHWQRYGSTLQNKVRELHRKAIGDILGSLITAPNAGPDPNIDPEKVFDRMLAIFGSQRSAFDFIDKQSFREAFKRNPNVRAVVDTIERIEKTIDELNRPKTNLQSFVDNLIQGGKRIVVGEDGFDVKVGDQSIGPRSLSHGEKHVLRLLVAATRLEWSSLLIDEPEMSLHLEWQTKLLGMMRELNPTTQLIVATHSPEIMAEWPDEKIFRIV
jgi:hypothetical protein